MAKNVKKQLVSNDALISHGNQRFHSGDLDLWKKMKEGGFDLIKEESGVNLKMLLEILFSTNLSYALIAKHW